MSDVYQHQVVKFADAGLQLRTPPDLIPPNQYARLTNAVPLIEGRLEPRAAIQLIVNLSRPTSPGSGVHSIARLNQGAIAAVGDRIVGVDTTVQTLALPAGNFPLTRDTQRSGDPLSLPVFRFEADPSAWQIVADRAGMRKYRGGAGSGYYEALGILPPSRNLANGGIIGAAASAVAVGAGNLSGGLTAGNVVVRPTTLLNGWGTNGHVGAYELGVDQGFGFGLNGPAVAYNNPGNAFDGDESTAASIVLLHTHTYAGCVWHFTFTGSVVVGLSLNILSEVPPPGGFGIPPSGWLRSAGIWYSLDGGATWTEVYNSSMRTKQWDRIPLASTQDLNQVQVMAFMDAHDDMAHNVYEINIAPSVTPGPGYDWVYTYVNTITQSESNPSITNWGNQFEQTFPQTITTPDPSFGGSAASSIRGGGSPNLITYPWSNSLTPNASVVDLTNTFEWTIASNGFNSVFIQKNDLTLNTTVASGSVNASGIAGFNPSTDSTPGFDVATFANCAVDADGFLWLRGTLNGGTTIAIFKVNPTTMVAVAAVSIPSSAGSSGLFTFMTTSTAFGGSYIVGFISISGTMSIFVIDTRAVTFKGYFRGFVVMGGETQVLTQYYPVADANGFVYVIFHGVTGSIQHWYIGKINILGPTALDGGGVPVFTSTTTFTFVPDVNTGSGNDILWNPADNTLIVYTNVGAFLRVDVSAGTVLASAGSVASPLFNISSGAVGGGWLSFEGGGGASSSLQYSMRGQVQNGILWAPSLPSDPTSNSGFTVLVYLASNFTLLTRFWMGNFPLSAAQPALTKYFYEPQQQSLLFPWTQPTNSTKRTFLALTFTSTGGTLHAASSDESRQSILFSNWTTATQQYAALYLEIEMTVTVTGGDQGGCVYWAVYFTRDAGITWNLVLDGNTSVDYGATDLQPSFLLFLNPAQDLSKLQVRAVVLGVGDTVDAQNVTARRVRDQAGNLNVAGLLTGGGGNRQVTLIIADIKATGVFLTATPNTLSLASQQANVTVINPLDPQVDAIRLYRRGGTVTASWAFVKQYPVTAHDGLPIILLDNVADTNLASFVFQNNDAPVTSQYAQNRVLPYLWGPVFDPPRVFGAGDPDRPGSVYFSNPSNADQWDPNNLINVSSPSDPVVGGLVFNTRNYAFSKERMFEITPSLAGGGVFVPFDTPCRRGLISPWALVTTARAIYFVAKDGIYATTGGEEQSLVENNLKPLFPTLDYPLGQAVNGYEAVNLERIEDLRLRYHNDELYFVYRGIGSGRLHTLVYDQNKNRWRAVDFPLNPNTGQLLDIVTYYSEEGVQSSLLVGGMDGSLYNTAGSQADTWLLSGTPTTSPIQASVQTGAFDQGMPLNLKEYGNVLFDVDPSGATVASPITITPVFNGVLGGPTLTITGSGRNKFPLPFPIGDTFGFNLAFLIQFSASATIHPVLYQFDILWRPEPVSVTHWEARESSYGMPGYFHLRDSYVAIRSTASVTLTMTFDGITQTYTLASTGGQRRKVYLPFQANKGRVYHFSFDATDGVTPFRLYVEDCEMRAKPFITSLGYQVVRAWGAESQLVTAAYESSLLGGGR